jgi:hypothetical protein
MVGVADELPHQRRGRLDVRLLGAGVLHGSILCEEVSVNADLVREEFDAFMRGEVDRAWTRTSPPKRRGSP